MLIKLNKNYKIENKYINNGYLLKCENSEIFCDDSMQLYISNGKNNHPKFRSISSLKRKDAIYNVHKIKASYIISDIEIYTKGYLRGLVDSDGTYEYRKDARGKIQIVQKNGDLVQQFKVLYNKYIAPTEAKVFLDNNMYKFNGCRITFQEKTKFLYENNDYLWGYLIGFFIGDGCLSYNKSNRHLNWFISQSRNKKPIYCNYIEYILNKFNIRYNFCDSKVNNFYMTEDCIMRNYQGSGVDIINWPFIYNCTKLHKIEKILATNLSLKCSVFYYEPILEIQRISNININYINTSETYILNNFIVKNND